MEIVKNIRTFFSNKMASLVVFLMSASLSTFAFAGDGKATPSGDIVKTMLSGSIGQTLGSGGMLWGLLTAIGFAVTIFHATTTNNPKAAIPGFILSALVSTVTTYFITF